MEHTPTLHELLHDRGPLHPDAGVGGVPPTHVQEEEENAFAERAEARLLGCAPIALASLALLTLALPLTLGPVLGLGVP